MKNIIKENGYTVEQSISGYWRLIKNGEVIYDDSACEDLNEDRETAEAFFTEFLKNSKVSNVNIYPSNMEVFTEGAGCIHIERDTFSWLNEDEAREELTEKGILLKGDIDDIIGKMQTAEWLSEE